MKKENIYNGIVGARKIAEHLDINYHTLEHRLRTMSIEDAVSGELVRSKRSYEYKGVTGLANICEIVGIKLDTMKARLKKMTLDEAINFDPVEARKIRDKKRKADGDERRKRNRNKLPPPDIETTSNQRLINAVFR